MVRYDPAADPVHGTGWNSAAQWGGWVWREPRYGDHFRTCSFCGCIHPEDLAAEQGWRASWADMKYGWPHKFYVEGIRPRDPDLLHCLGHATHELGSWGDRSTWVAAADLTGAQQEIIRADGMHAGGQFDGWYLFAAKTSLFAKFYTVHLRDPRLSQEVTDAIQRASGLRFTWLEDGRVSWQRWEQETPA